MCVSIAQRSRYLTIIITGIFSVEDKHHSSRRGANWSPLSGSNNFSRRSDVIVIVCSPLPSPDRSQRRRNDDAKATSKWRGNEQEAQFDHFYVAAASHHHRWIINCGLIGWWRKYQSVLWSWDRIWGKKRSWINYCVIDTISLCFSQLIIRLMFSQLGHCNICQKKIQFLYDFFFYSVIIAPDIFLSLSVCPLRCERTVCWIATAGRKISRW